MGAVLYGARPGNRENLANMLTLYGHPESGHTYKVALSLALMDEPFEYRWVDVFAPRAARDPEFQRVSRFGEIPVLVDAGVAYAQSDAILLQLAGKHCRLGGETPARLAQVRERLFWEANRVGISLPNLRHYQRFAPGTASAGALEWLRARMLADFAALDQQLTAQPFLLDGEVTVADIACSAYLLYEDAGLDLTKWPAMQAWLGRIRALPGWQHPHTLLRKPA
jgi:glutathione S-transferase